MIGFGRAITDGVCRALLDDIIIDKDYQKKGLGGLMVKNLMQQLKDVEEVFLNTGEHLESFYEKQGFKQSTGITMKF